MYKIKAFVPYETGEEREPKRIKFGSLNFAETTFETERLIEFLIDFSIIGNLLIPPAVIRRLKQASLPK